MLDNSLKPQDSHSEVELDKGKKKKDINRKLIPYSEKRTVLHWKVVRGLANLLFPLRALRTDYKHSIYLCSFKIISKFP